MCVRASHEGWPVRTGSPCQSVPCGAWRVTACECGGGTPRARCEARVRCATRGMCVCRTKRGGRVLRCAPNTCLGRRAGIAPSMYAAACTPAARAASPLCLSTAPYPPACHPSPHARARRGGPLAASRQKRRPRAALLGVLVLPWLPFIIMNALEGAGVTPWARRAEEGDTYTYAYPHAHLYIYTCI